jgi:hypothetical protein
VQDPAAALRVADPRSCRQLGRLFRFSLAVFMIPQSITHMFFLAGFLLGTQLACATSTEPNSGFADVCEIHLQAWFSHTPVKVAVDYSEVFDDTITTGDILAFAAIVPVQVSRGVHALRVTADGSFAKDTTFTIIDSLYVGVNYNVTTSRINYIFQRHPFRYR